MTGELRLAAISDAPGLAAIHGTAFPPGERWGQDAISLQLAMPGAFGVWHPAGGMLLARVAADQAEVLTLAVAPHARRRGIAADLLEAACGWAAAHGAVSLFLEVSTANAAARALYARSDFHEVGRRYRYYSDGNDALVLSRALTT